MGTITKTEWLMIRACKTNDLNRVLKIWNRSRCGQADDAQNWSYLSTNLLELLEARKDGLSLEKSAPTGR